MLKLKESVFDTPVAQRAVNVLDDDEISRHDVVTLTTQQAVKWGRMKYMILSLPDDPYWKNVIAVSSLVNFFLGTTCFFFAREYNRNFIPIYVICDLLYWTNVILLSLHRFWKKLREKIFTVHVSKLSYTLDLISLLPQEFLVIALFGDEFGIAVYLRWITYIRLKYLAIYFSVLKELLENRWKHTLLAFLICSTVVAHMTTCIFYEMSCHHQRCSKPDMEQGVEDISQIWFVGEWSQSIVEKYPYYKTAGTFEWYILSFYISMEYLLNVGTGLHRASSLQEMILFSILMMFGYIFFKVWMLYSCFELLVVGRRSEAHYNHKVTCIKLYLKDVNITRRAMRNITEYFNILWNKKEGLKSAEHFYSLPTPLQMEITYDLNCVHLNHSLLLFDLKEFYLRTISLFMKHEFLLPGDILYYQGVVKTHLVIIIKGVLEILSDEDDESTILAFQAGTVLGEACLFLSLPAKATVRAAVYTEVKLIDRVDFIKNISNYPIAFSYLRERIIFRIRTMKNQIARNVARRSREGDKDEDDLIPIKVIKDYLTRSKNITASDGLNKGPSLVSTKEKKETLPKICKQLLSLYKLSDEDSNVEKPVICLNYRFPFILDSTSSLIKYWEYFILILHFTAIMVYTYEFVFLRKLHVVTLTLLICSNGASIIDVLVLTCTTVVFKDRVLQTFGEIVGYRIKSIAFYVYILSVLPISYIIEITISSLGIVIHRRISDFMITINCLRMVRCISILSATNFHKKNALSSITFIVFCMTLASYFLACVYYLFSCFTVICSENSWFAMLVKEEVLSKISNPFYEDILSTSFYLASNIWVRVGVGDITIGLPTDIFLLIFTSIIGLIIITYLMSSLAATLSIVNSKSELYEQQVFSFQRFLEHSRVPVQMKEQVDIHFALEWAYDGSIGRNEFKKMAPEHLQMVVFRTDLMKLLNRVPLFQLVDVDFLMHVVLSSTITILPRHATVCYAGDVDREMFIIQKGTCEVFDSAGIFIRDMTVGDSYGDIEMLFNMTKSATIRTITNCKIMVVTFRDFNSALSMFPTEMRIAHKFMYDSDFWRIVDIIEQKRMISFMRMKTSEVKKKKMWTEIRQKFRKSFICAANCYESSKRRELYWDPFRKMGKWQIIGILFMPVTIHPEALVLKLWIALRILLLLAMGFCIPRSIGLPPNQNSVMRATILITEISAYIEIYLFFHIAYYNRRGLLISHPKLTARNYLAHNFVMDVVAAFPYYSIIQYVEPNHRDNLDPTVAHLVSHESYCVWRCMVLLQFYRVIGFLNYIQKNVLLKKNVLIFTVIFLSVIAFLFILSTIVIAECEFIFSVLEYGQEVDETRYSIQIYDDAVGLYYIGYLTCEKESWPQSNKDYCPKSPHYLIYCAFNWFIDIFCHMGTKEISPYSQTDIKSNIVLIFLGAIWTTYIIVFSCKATGLSSATSVDYQQKVKELMKFLYKENVSPVKINKIYRYFEYVWKRTTGMENREMLNDLNSALKGDIALFLYEKTLRDVAIFRKIARPYLRVIAKNLKEEYFLKSDNLIRCYDVHNSVYIIMRGKVNVLTPYDELVETIGVGGLFGNIHQASPGCSSSTFVAQRNVDALKMTSETFFLLAQEYPAINDVLFSVLNMTGDFIMPAHQVRNDQGSRLSGLYSEGSSEYEEDVYTQDIDITSDYGNSPYYEQDIIVVEETIEKEEEQPKEMETEKKTMGAVRETKRHLVIPKSHFLVLLLFLRPKYWFKFALEPNHRFFELVRYATFMATSYQVFAVPYVCVSQNFNHYLIFPSYIVEPIYYLRIFFFMHEAYLDIYGTYEKRFKMIAKNYLKDYRRVFWDVTPNLPIYLFCFLAEPDKRLMTYSFLRLYQMLRIKYIYEAFALWSAPLLAKRAQLLFYKMLFTFLLAIHYMLLLYLLVQLFHQEITLASRDFVRNGGHLEAYMFYLYIASNLISTTAMGDYVSHTLTEGYLNLIGTAFTKIIFALLIAFFSTVSIMLLQHLLNYEYKVNELIKFLANQGLSDHLKKKLWIYVKQMWKTQYGIHIPVLLENAPYDLKCEIMREIYSVHLRDGYLFRDINEALLRQICGHLKRIVFFRGNYIVQNGDTNASMYWIHRGEVSVLTVHPNLTETCHDILHVHDMFGLAQGLNYGMPHKYSYRAETQCDILILKLEIWESVLQQFPNDKDIIYKRMFNLYTIL